MKLQLAPRDAPSARSLRRILQEAAESAGLGREELVADAVQWGVLKEDLLAEGSSADPTVTQFAERFGRSREQAEKDLEQFSAATGLEPLEFWRVEEEALDRAPGPARAGAPLDEVFAVVVDG